MAKSKPAKMSAILGRCRRTGRWRIAKRSSVLALLGSCRLDMRSSFVEDDGDQLKMTAMVVLGSAVFILPDGAEVRPSGMSLLSAEVVDVPEHAEPSGLPILDIEYTCILGRVHVVTGSTLAKLEAEAAAAKERRRNGKKGQSKGKGKSKATSTSRVALERSSVEQDDASTLSTSTLSTSMLSGDGAVEQAPTADPGAEPVATWSAEEPAATTDAWAGHDWGSDDSPVGTDPDLPPVTDAWRTHDWSGDGAVDETPAGGDTSATGTDLASDAAPSPEDDIASTGESSSGEEPAPLAEAWRTHDWAGDDDGADPAGGGTEELVTTETGSGLAAEAAAPAEDAGEAGEPAPVAEAWRTHDWGGDDDGAIPLEPDRDEAEVQPDRRSGPGPDEEPVPEESEPEPEHEVEAAIGDDVAAPVLEAWRTHDWGPGKAATAADDTAATAADDTAATAADDTAASEPAAASV